MNNLIPDDEKIADEYLQNGNYKKAIFCYSRLLNASKHTSQTSGKFEVMALILFRHKRSFCYEKTKHYSKYLADLNWIIAHSKRERGSQIFWNPRVITIYQNALFRRANLFMILGNSAQSFTDYGRLTIIPKNLCIDRSLEPIVTKKSEELMFIRHPSPQTMINNNRSTLKLNKLSLNGWKKLQSKKGFRPLPFKHGHQIIEHKGKIYCFGGSNIMYGQGLFVKESIIKRNILFLEISLFCNQNNFDYSWKPLKFPDAFRKRLCKIEAIANWSKTTTINKWNDNIILFGGNNPFLNVLIFQFSTMKWSRFNVKQRNVSKNVFRKQIVGHSSNIINNKLYVYGGDDINSLFCLDLLSHKWVLLTGPDDNENIPEQRFDHFMWNDINKGTEGSLYVGYGSYDHPDFDIPCIRRNIWRYDIALNKWNLVSPKGNFPVHRTECGITSISRTENKNGCIVFGGFNSTLYTALGNINKPDSCSNYVYLADCFEYCSNFGKWKMIQTETYPSHRASPAMCQISDNMIVLFGGYHGGDAKTGKLFNDLWILNLNEMQTTNFKFKKCNVCQKSCKEIKVYLCNRCGKARYCGKKCQEVDWPKHESVCI